MPYCNDLPLFSLQPEFYNSGKILSEIINECPVCKSVHRDRMHFLMGAHRTAVICSQIRFKLQLFHGRLPPCDLFKIDRCVIRLSIVNISHAVRPVLCHFPRAVSSYDLPGAVLISNPEFRQKRLSVGVMPVFSRKHERADRPAARHNCGQNILFLEHLRDIISLILHFMPVRCKAGSKIPVSRFLSVYCQLIYAQCRSIKLCAFYFLCTFDFSAEHHRDRGHFFLREPVCAVRDPLSVPRRPHPAGLKLRLRLCSLPRIVLRRYFYLINGKRLKRSSFIGHQYLGICLHRPVSHGDLRLLKGHILPVALQPE